MPAAKRMPWIDFAGQCPSCVPDENKALNFEECYECLLGVVEPIVGQNACNTCCQLLENDHCRNDICHDIDRPFRKVHAIGYRHPGNFLYKLIYNLKFRNRGGNELPLAVLLAGYLRASTDVLSDYDILTPIPRTSEKSAHMGDPLLSIFGRAKDLATQIGAADVASKMAEPGSLHLKKTYDTGKATDKLLPERRSFASLVEGGSQKNPYKIAGPKQRVTGASVLLVDDIFTTGYHTMYLASLVLKKSGAASVDGLVLAREMWRNRPK